MNIKALVSLGRSPPFRGGTENLGAEIVHVLSSSFYSDHSWEPGSTARTHSLVLSSQIYVYKDGSSHGEAQFYP